ncbi:MAG: penicillin-binding transpeptidase domain-containing protein [Phycisphaerae bacterium]
MFEQRLKILLAMMGFALAILVVRLIDMQIVHAHMYEEQADRALLLRPKTLPTVRGSILDRTGKLLVSDEPCWDIKVDYGILSGDKDYHDAMVKRLKHNNAYGRKLSIEDVERQFNNDVDRMWEQLATFFDGGTDELHARAREICDRIEAIREDVARRRGFSAPVREERMSHAIVEGLTDQEQVDARSVLSPYPWVEVEDSTKRVYRGGAPLAHILGQVVPVTAEHLQSDIFAEDRLRSLLGTDRIGGSGIEYSMEAQLRGSRGEFHGNRAGEVLTSSPPVPGEDVRLTIRSDLQSRLYEMFGEQIAPLPYSLSGSIVVLDPRNRDCLAMVSYPSYDPQTFREHYNVLRDDTRRNPLAFRAVSRQYAPGSIVKPLVCLAGLITGKITTATTFTCEGALFPSQPDRWRCWAAAGTSMRKQHGPLVAWEAIKYSCNIFMYNTGQLLGADTLTNFFDMFGLGKESGTGLREEVPGINPTPNFMESIGHPLTPGSPRQFAIGQAEVAVTPIQAANLMASYATGEYRHVSLVRTDAESPVWELPGSPTYWQVIRRGMFGVVNDTDGTAYTQARIPIDTGYVLIGKTGSAETVPAPTAYAIPYEDTDGSERTALIYANTMSDAIDFLLYDHPDATFDPRSIEVAERWPSEAAEHGRKHSHAWFVAYMQKADANGQPLWNQVPHVAFSVMVEYGGSGGRVSGAIAQKVADVLLDVLGPDLDPDYVAVVDDVDHVADSGAGVGP